MNAREEMNARFEAEKKRIVESGMLDMYRDNAWDKICVSILSDIQEEITFNLESANEKINFVKFLLITKND